MAVAVSVAAGIVYLLVRPAAPDLPAQLARASAVSRGAGLWWGGWYGGINTSTYSLLSARLMNAAGVATVGVVSTVIIALCAAQLARTAERPAAGAAAAAAAAAANLYSGRMTFAAGMALALVSLCALLRRWRGLAVVAAALCGLVSPLAAMAELIALSAVLTVRQHRRPLSLVVMAAAAGPAAVLSVLFAQPSYMPFSIGSCVFALLACAGVALAPVPAPVRLLAAVSATIAVGAVLVHSPLGSNAGRLPMLAAAPLVVATARRREVVTRIAVVGLALWPMISFTGDMAIAAQPSSQAAFYAPLLARLPAANTAVQRVEVLDPRTHGAAYYLSTQVPLARGWERQIDVADNPMFYNGGLTPASYREWLVAHAVGWVAEPLTHLDFGSTAERSLIGTQLPYLTLSWSNPHWRLYRVTVPAPAAEGVLRPIALTDAGVELLALAPGTGVVRTPYSRLLTVRAMGDPRIVGCVRPDSDDNTAVSVSVPEPGLYQLHAELGALTTQCPAAASTPAQ